MAEMTEQQRIINEGRRAAARLHRITQLRDNLTETQTRIRNAERQAPFDGLKAAQLVNLRERVKAEQFELDIAVQMHEKILASEAAPKPTPEELAARAAASRAREAAKWVEQRELRAVVAKAGLK